MANILEYLEWRGDLPLSSVPFNEVDAAILARLSYLPLEAVLENQGGTKQSGKAKELTVAQAMEALAAADAEQLRFLWHEDPKLINALRASRRFAQLSIFSYSERLDIPSQTQFAAVSIRLAPALCYVPRHGRYACRLAGGFEYGLCLPCPLAGACSGIFGGACKREHRRIYHQRAFQGWQPCGVCGCFLHRDGAKTGAHGL